MNFCAMLQSQLAAAFPGRRWKVVENTNPGTSVIILAQGQHIPGEVIVTCSDPASAREKQQIVAGQAYCDYLQKGRTDAEFARVVGEQLQAQLDKA